MKIIKGQKGQDGGVFAVILIIILVAATVGGCCYFKYTYEANPYKPNETPKRLDETRIGSMRIPSTNGVLVEIEETHWWIIKTNGTSVSFDSLSAKDKEMIAQCVMNTLQNIERVEEDYAPDEGEVREITEYYARGRFEVLGAYVSASLDTPVQFSTNTTAQPSTNTVCVWYSRRGTNENINFWYANTNGWKMFDLCPYFDTNGYPLEITGISSTAGAIPAVIERASGGMDPTNWTKVVTIGVPTNGVPQYYMEMRGQPAVYRVRKP